MKKLVVLVVVLALAMVAWASACESKLEVKVNGCENTTLTGTYVDDDRLFKGVRVFVDGVKVAENGAWDSAEMRKYDISASYTITTPGTYAVTVKGYDHAAMVVVDKTFKQKVTVESCDKPTPEPTTIPTEPTPTPTVCKEIKQSYGLAELWSAGGDYAVMYIYPDAYGNLPMGIGVERQQCVLGWVAVRSGMFDYVYKNSCTGEYTFNEKPITPRADVLKNNVCARNGACR